MGFRPQNSDSIPGGSDRRAHSWLPAQLTQLTELLADTQTALGSDLMVQATEAYAYMGNSRARAGLEELRKDLGARFNRRSPASSIPAQSAAAAG